MNDRSLHNLAGNGLSSVKFVPLHKAQMRMVCLMLPSCQIKNDCWPVPCEYADLDRKLLRLFSAAVRGLRGRSE